MNGRKLNGKKDYFFDLFIENDHFKYDSKVSIKKTVDLLRKLKLKENKGWYKCVKKEYTN